jgi:uncharacterized protein DUF3500
MLCPHTAQQRLPLRSVGDEQRVSAHSNPAGGRDESGGTHGRGGTSLARRPLPGTAQPGSVAVAVRRGTPPLVLHPHRPRRAATGAHATGPAEPSDAAGRDRPVQTRLRHRDHDHGLENVLDQVENWQVDWGRERGRDPQMYWLKIFGEPDLQGSWSWRFGGHHVSVQHSIRDGEVIASSPSFLGADPAESPLLGGHLLRPLGAAEDFARELVRSLDEGQAAEVLISPVAPVDIVGGNRPHLHDGDMMMALPDVWRERFTEPRLRDLVHSMHEASEVQAGLRPEHHRALSLTTAPKGIAAGSMTDSQRELLRAVLDVFVGRIPEELAEREAEKFAGAKLDAVHFAWAGGVERDQPHYYRLQGPRLLAEYDNTQRDVNHIHTVWRDPSADFGDDVLARHHAEFHGQPDSGKPGHRRTIGDLTHRYQSHD